MSYGPATRGLNLPCAMITVRDSMDTAPRPLGEDHLLLSSNMFAVNRATRVLPSVAVVFARVTRNLRNARSDSVVLDRLSVA